MATYRWALYLLLSGVLTSCGGGPSDWPVSHDLSAGFAGAQLASETRTIDIGTASGRRHLVSGWTEDRWDARRKRTYVISEGSESVFAIELIEPRQMVLQLNGRAVDAKSGVVIGVDVLVNGYPVDSLQLEERPRRFQFPIQESVLRAKKNEVVLRYRRSDGADPEYEAAWYRFDLVFADQPDPPMPTRVGQGEALMIPYGTRLEYTMRLPAVSALTIERVRHLGESGGVTVLKPSPC